ncbi:MAG: F0F1 ATP synthase subunit delta [Candidatus Portnoybacteria bacterium]|nr:F0F1 ATP synthase subunit delta [Candidatus Portnoybacteria bacterium]
MKYSPQIYAKAFSEIAVKPSAKSDVLVKNLLILIKKNNDQHLLKKIYERAEKLVREQAGKRKVVIETARPIKNVDKVIEKIVKKDDILDKRINPDLIAGMRVIINDEVQFDGSMARKLKQLFK